MDGMHHIQQHVVANHKFTLCVRWNGLRVQGRLKGEQKTLKQQLSSSDVKKNE